MSTTTLNIPPLGDVVFSQSQRARRISISIRPFKPIRVAFPLRTSFKKARKCLLDNMAWAKKSLAHIRKVEREHKAAAGSGPEIPRAKARRLLTRRLGELAERHDFKYNRVFIRNQKTRWGSCSTLNNISLNINLVSLSQDLTDYVLLHELLHTRIKNHSKEFWAQLDKYVAGSAKDLHRRLKKHRLGVGV